MSYLSTIFGSNVFNDSVMRERLPKETYKVFKKTLAEGKSMDPSVAEIVAANPTQADDFRNGKTKIMGFFVGQLMKKTKGQANPKMANDLFVKALSS